MTMRKEGLTEADLERQKGAVLITVMIFSMISMMIIGALVEVFLVQEARAIEQMLTDVRMHWGMRGQMNYALSRAAALHRGDPWTDVAPNDDGYQDAGLDGAGKAPNEFGLCSHDNGGGTGSSDETICTNNDTTRIAVINKFINKLSGGTGDLSGSYPYHYRWDYSETDNACGITISSMATDTCAKAFFTGSENSSGIYTTPPVTDQGNDTDGHFRITLRPVGPPDSTIQATYYTANLYIVGSSLLNSNVFNPLVGTFCFSGDTATPSCAQTESSVTALGATYDYGKTLTTRLVRHQGTCFVDTAATSCVLP